MQLNIRIPYEVCKVVNGKKEIIEVVAGSPLEAMWAAYRTCVTMRLTRNFQRGSKTLMTKQEPIKLNTLKR